MPSHQLFESFADVPAAWHEICAPDDLAMDAKALAVYQRTLANQCRCWGLVVCDDSGIVIGCAALCLFPTELIETANPALVRWRDGLRRIWPGFARMNVLFCGLPVPSGSTHLRVRAGAAVAQVVEEVDKAMQQLAGKTGGRLTVFKELDASSAEVIAALTSRGYLRGDIPPMHLLELSYENFDAYRDALKSRYRAQVQRSQKKLVSAGFEVLSGRGGAFVAKHFDAHVHMLYIAVQRQAAQKLELMPPAFFREMADALGDDVLLTLIRRNGIVCAFTFSITRRHTHYNMYSGLDYTLNNEGDLYFNLFYQDMDRAFRSGVKSLHLGQTSDSFKSRLGTATEKLWFFAHGHPPLLHAALRLFAPLAFPKVAPVEANDVFAAPPQSKPTKVQHP